MVGMGAMPALESIKNKEIAILGSGPAGLMAAFEAARAGLRVRVFEKRKALGRKLLVAGSSGLNITYECPLDEFVRHYSEPRERFEAFLEAFGPAEWRAFIEGELGIPTFKGTSRRWFVASDGMKASGLLKAWIARLEAMGVRFELGRECVGFRSVGKGKGAQLVELEFADGARERFAAAGFCLGGGSWEPQEQPLRWPRIFRERGIAFREFAPSNVGFQVAWPEALLAEAEGKPIKNVVLRSSRGERSGDLVITRYGIEGTPVYFAGEKGVVYLDLKPDLTEEQVLRKLEFVKENLSPLRRAKKVLKLGEGALALLYHVPESGGSEPGAGLRGFARRIKRFELELREPQPLAEAISSSGGVSWDELDRSLMLKRFPGVFAAGEMIDWDAPTGGFLIQGCVSQGAWVGREMVGYCAKEKAAP
jgi:uncharacterized flavoprotein (TIGR03862 family)